MIAAADIARNLDRVRERIAAAGADPDRVTVVAVTKGHPASVVEAAREAGLVDLGENYAQELVPKAEACLAAAEEISDHGSAAAPRWHFIGRLQRNKVRLVAPFVHLWQSVDRLSLAAEIARRSAGAAVLLQVNVSGEEAKGGCRPELLGAFVEGSRDLGLDVRGLMTVAPEGDPDAARAAFAGLARLADRFGLEERSMGMSGDLDLAVAEGSTMVRVGTALLGPRPVAARVRD